MLDDLWTIKLYYISKTSMTMFEQTSGNKLWFHLKYSRLCSQHFVNVESSLEKWKSHSNDELSVWKTMIDTSQVLKGVPSLEWRNLKMVFPESKNNMLLFWWRARFVPNKIWTYILIILLSFFVVYFNVNLNNNIYKYERLFYIRHNTMLIKTLQVP